MKNRRAVFLVFLYVSLISGLTTADDMCVSLEQRYTEKEASPIDAYNMACCAALKGKSDAAFGYLETAVKKGYRDSDWMKQDRDLVSLHKDPRWTTIVAKIHKATETYLSQINKELLEMFQADQAERQTPDIDWNIIAENDKKRRHRTQELLDNNKLKHGDDYYHAAMIFQHGDTPEHYKKAHDLARKAARLNPVNATAKWLSCAAEDRYLQSLGKAQVWGTQYRKPDMNGPWTLEPFDRSAKTDDERKEWGVPTIKQSEAYVAKMNKDEDAATTTKTSP